MDHTSLDLCLRINCLNSFFKTRKTIHAEEKDIFYSAVLKIIKHPKPELAGFICAYCDAEDIFVSLHCNAKNYIRSTTQDSAILTYFIMNNFFYCLSVDLPYGFSRSQELHPVLPPSAPAGYP